MRAPIPLGPTASLANARQEAELLLNRFAQFTEYQHGRNNPHLSWLAAQKSLAVQDVIRFLCIWYSVSKHQPQLLLLCAASYPDAADRALIMLNYREEDGQVNEGDSPHYDLLESLIGKLGGVLAIDPVSEQITDTFHRSVGYMTPAEASGFLAAIEHPALDISAYLHALLRLCGFKHLLQTDPYLTIHVNVEPHHILWSHGTALRYMQRGTTERTEVLTAFRKVMTYWEQYWPYAFSVLHDTNPAA